MFWLFVVGAALCAWTFLSAIANERARQVHHIEREARAAAREAKRVAKMAAEKK